MDNRTAEQLVSDFKKGVTDIRVGFKKLLGIAEQLERVSTQQKNRLTQSNARASRRVIGASLRGLDHLVSIDLAYRRDEDRRKEDEKREKQIREAAQMILENRRRQRELAEAEAGTEASKAVVVEEDVEEEVLTELTKMAEESPEFEGD